MFTFFWGDSPRTSVFSVLDECCVYDKCVYVYHASPA